MEPARREVFLASGANDTLVFHFVDDLGPI
jgi:hypothetical protein